MVEFNPVKHERAEVLVVGAGPTGLVLACELRRRGVAVRVVERGDALFPGSRGKGLQPRTREILDDLGVGAGIAAHGGPYPEIQLWRQRRGHATRAERHSLVEATAPEPGAPYGAVWMVPQWRTQELLHERLVELGGTVEFGAALTSLTQDGDAVLAELATGERIEAAYLVGTDGGRSTVRREVGIPREGEQVDATPTIVADVRVRQLDRDDWHFWHTATGSVGLCPLPGTDTFQAALAPARADGDAAGTVRRLLAEHTHLAPEQLEEVVWASEFTTNAALVERYRAGRVLLAGDAAHLHSPAGGQGLNTGIQDAYNLGWKLAHALRATPAEAEPLLDSFETERRPAAAQALGLSAQLHRATRSGDREGARRGRETHQLDLSYREGPLAWELRRSPTGTLRAGDRAPDGRCTTVEGEEVRLFDLLHGTHTTVLAFGDVVPQRASPGVRLVRVADAEPHVFAAYGTSGVFVVRPDGHLAAAAEAWDDLPHAALAAVGLA